MADNKKIVDINDKRTRLEVLREQLFNERASFTGHWRDLGDYILPRRPRFFTSDANRGERKNTKIIDSTAALAARTLRSGMMGGITSPARPWFRLTTPDAELAEFGPVKEWLHVVTQRMTTVFLRSNLYNALPLAYGDMGTFGTAALMLEEDFKKVIRFYVFPIGSYMISNNEYGVVDVFFREFRMTVRQMLKKFGVRMPNGEYDWTNFSEQVKSLYKEGQYETWIDVCHVIMPNEDYDPGKLKSKFKKFVSIYYERGYSGTGSNNSNYLNNQDRNRYLREAGFDFFPVLVPRWETTGEDIYGTSCPGMDALGDVKALQLMHKRKAQAIEKMVNPPMTGPTVLKRERASLFPGDITYVDTPEGRQGFRPAYQIDPRIQELVLDIQDHQHRVKRAFFEDLFRMLIDDPRAQPPTAEEIRERQGEKLLAIGPVLEQLNQDLLDPLIDNTFTIMLRQGFIPPPPEELQGMDLKVEYISIMAQAQKLVGIAGLERFSSYVSTLVQTTGDLTILDKVDTDQLIDEYGDAVSVPPRVVRPDEKVAEIREGRRQAAEAQRKAEMVAAGAKTAKDLSQTDTGGENALTELMKTAKAGSLAPAQ